MRTRGPVVPLLVGLVGGAVLVTGTVQASSLRHDEQVAREARARAAAQVRAEKAYVAALRPVLEDVYDQVQPLHDAFDAFDEPHEYDLSVRDDVLGRSGARPVVLARLAALRRVPVPERFAVVAPRLDKALVDFARAADLLAAATDPKVHADADGDVRGFGDGRAYLASATSAWSSGTALVFLDGSRPSVPGPGRDGALPGRSPRSKGAYLYTADRICGGADTASAGLPDPTDLGSFLRLAPKQVALAQGAVQRLQVVPAPRADAAVLTRTVGTPLRTFGRGLAVTHTVLARLRAGRSGLSATEVQALRRSDDDARAVAKGYAAYGATVCSDFFDPGPADAPAPVDSGDTVSA
ncbi:MAG: hypothetical protein JWN17_2691 [Frankiales bacterium]|nr:hypothetical protein [Frankiales bacterium]